ncbi:MAG: hypothetical protein ABEJ31_11725 [Haloarculaceae archaeon]
MTRQQLQDAAEHLERASEHSADADDAERLAELAEQLATLADRDRSPDHGRLARIQSALSDLLADAHDEAAAAIQDADDAIDGFRETLEGV